MIWIDRIHRWTGASIGLLLAALALSGTLLLCKDAWLRATVPHAAAPQATVATAISATQRLLADAASRPTAVVFPTDSLALFRLTFADGSGAYADQSGEIVLRWASKWERLELWLFDFHHYLWMGKAGAALGGILGLIGVGFVVTGAVLWWRRRKAFALRLLPANLSRSQIAGHHRDAGLVTSPLLLLALLTGAMLTLRPVANFLLGPLSPPGTIDASLAAPAAKGGPLAATFDWRAMLQQVHETYPHAELRTVGVPTSPGGLVIVRARQPAEWLPNGRTTFWFDAADGHLIEARDALTLPLAARAFNLVYPLHAAKVGGLSYKAAMTVVGLVLTLLGTLAVYAFWRPYTLG